jgi:signal transduction histidine kinase
VSRRRGLPIGASLALAFALAIALPGLVAGATWLAVGARQQAGVDASVRKATALLAGAGASMDDPAVRSRVLRRLAELGVEADVLDVGPKPVAGVVAAPEGVGRSEGPLMTKGLDAMLSVPAGKKEIAARFQQHTVDVGPVAATLFVAAPSAAVRLAATCAAGLLTLALALVAGVVLLRRWVVRPLAQLAADAQRIAGGDLDVAPVDSRAREVAEVGTALRGMADGLREALHERDAAEQQRRFLVGSIAHDLRTPLFTLRGSLEAIEHGIGDGDQLRRAQDKATLLDRLVGDLFAFSRLEYAEPQLQREPHDAADLARSAADTVDARILVDVPPVAPQAFADRAAMLRVLVNLLDNAMRHAASTVSLRVAASGEDVVFVVEDDGSGIAEADLPQLFDPLFRADRTRNSATGGAGLGLAIVQRLTHAHGGEVRAENRREGGARFVVRVPAATAGRGAGRRRASPARPPSS